MLDLIALRGHNDNMFKIFQDLFNHPSNNYQTIDNTYQILDFSFDDEKMKKIYEDLKNSRFIIKELAYADVFQENFSIQNIVLSYTLKNPDFGNYMESLSSKRKELENKKNSLIKELQYKNENIGTNIKFNSLKQEEKLLDDSFSIKRSEAIINYFEDRGESVVECIQKVIDQYRFNNKIDTKKKSYKIRLFRDKKTN